MICLGVSPYTLAPILRCSVRGVYKWLDGEYARPIYIWRVKQLMNLLERGHVTTSSPIMKRYVFEKIAHGFPSLFEALQKWDFRMMDIVWMVEVAHEKSIRGRAWHRLRREKRKEKL